MAVHTKWRMFLIFLILKCSNVNGSQDIMKNITSSFAKVVKQCQIELSLGDEIITEFYSYWREDYQLVNRDMGCMILCMASKMELINIGDMKLHHGNAHDFAKSHGADDDIAKKLVSILHECEEDSINEADICTRVIEISKCFKTKMHDLKWAPPIEVILEEVMISV